MEVQSGIIAMLECFQRVLKLQNRAARIILDVDIMVPSIQVFNKLNWLSFAKESLIKTAMFTYKRKKVLIILLVI